MTAVAERTTQKNTTAGVVRTRRVRKARRASSRLLSDIVCCILILGIFGLFLYGAFKANMLTQYRHYVQIKKEQREETNRNEQLAARLNALNAPDRVIKAASETGMVYAQDYDYVGGVGKVASSSQ